MAFAVREEHSMRLIQLKGVSSLDPLDRTVEFLTHLGDLFCNFGIHLRGQTGMDSTLVDVQTCLQGVTKF